MEVRRSNSVAVVLAGAPQFRKYIKLSQTYICFCIRVGEAIAKLPRHQKPVTKLNIASVVASIIITAML